MRFMPLATAAALLTLAGCSTPAKAPQPSTTTPTPKPVLPPSPPPPVVRGADWRDWPITPGTWTYRQDARGSIALFGRPGSEADLTLRCDKGRGRMYLSRLSNGTGAITVRASTTLKTLNTQPSGGTPAYLVAELAPRDPIIDAVGHSRGRFMVEGAGGKELLVPAWPEILRVAEDCRG